jgi:hypothetical protein
MGLIIEYGAVDLMKIGKRNGDIRRKSANDIFVGDKPEGRGFETR